jgi:hypothetical protein
MDTGNQIGRMRATMQLRVEYFDGRHRKRHDVVDDDTGEKVGRVLCLGSGIGRGRSHGSIHVSLFDGKYEAYFYSYDGCRGFIQGVEAVLNLMIPTPKKTESHAA